MFKKTNKTIFRLIEVFADIGQKLTPDEVLFWSRNEDELLKLLKKGRIPFIQENGKVKRIASLEEADLTSVFKYKSPFNSYLDPSDRRVLKEHYPATSEAEVFCSDMFCALDTLEILRCVRQKYILSEVTFTPQQIGFLAQEQFSKRIPGPLSFRQVNYFPIEGAKGDILIGGLTWSDYKSQADEPKNKWKFFFKKSEDDFLRQEGNLLLLREVSD